MLPGDSVVGVGNGAARGSLARLCAGVAVGFVRPVVGRSYSSLGLAFAYAAVSVGHNVGANCPDSAFDEHVSMNMKKDVL